MSMRLMAGSGIDVKFGDASQFIAITKVLPPYRLRTRQQAGLTMMVREVKTQSEPILYN